MKPILRHLTRLVLALTAGLGLASFLQAGAPGKPLDIEHPNVRGAMELQAIVTPEIMTWPGVLGTAVGVEDDDAPSLVVYVDEAATLRDDIIRAFPPQVRGTTIKVHLTDKFRALAKPAAGKPGGGGGGGVSHTAKQTPPIQLGTSGGWEYDLANGYCCGGTLGSLIQVNGVQYILSNYHVFEADIVDGGNGRVAATGDPVIQPGLIDVNCSPAGAQDVATLVKLGSLPGSNVDCSIAQVVSGMVKSDGAILEIGTLSAQTAAASLKQAVKKSGRTTGLTRSTVSGLNATISVAYENECAGGAAFTQTFTGQIVIANRASKFLAGGDSGSLMVQDVATRPKAVGLLYAGSSTSAIASPIGEVLSFVGDQLGGTATMVGQ